MAGKSVVKDYVSSPHAADIDVSSVGAGHVSDVTN